MHRPSENTTSSAVIGLSEAASEEWCWAFDLSVNTQRLPSSSTRQDDAIPGTTSPLESSRTKPSYTLAISVVVNASVILIGSKDVGGTGLESRRVQPVVLGLARVQLGESTTTAIANAASTPIPARTIDE